MEIIQCDILCISHGLIGHQCNTKGVMGAGLALQIKKKYPHVYSSYQSACQSNAFKLGSIQAIQITPELYIVNLGAQESYGRNKTYTSYEALTTCLKKLYDFSKKIDLPIYLPYGLGCGLAGGNWSIVKELINIHCPIATLCKLLEQDNVLLNYQYPLLFLPPPLVFIEVDILTVGLDLGFIAGFFLSIYLSVRILLLYFTTWI